jgi:hypothetical protein
MSSLNIFLCEILACDRSSYPWGLLRLPFEKASFHYHINCIITDEGDEYGKRKWRTKGEISRLREPKATDGKKCAAEAMRRNATSLACFHISVSWSSAPKSFYKIEVATKVQLRNLTTM